MLTHLRTFGRRYGSALARSLDRPGWRFLLIIPGSIWVTFSYRAPCLVYWNRGNWVHHYAGARIPHASLGRAAPPSVFTSEARDIFLHEYTPRAGDVVFDVGAGIGAETLLFSRLVGRSGRVVSLEAHPRTYARLSSLCEANHLTNVTPLQVAASDNDGGVVISDSAEHLRNTLLDGRRDGGVEVPGRRLDSLASELGITRIDLLKLNIEGAERLAIEGLDGIIGATRHVCISCHDFLADVGASEDMRTKALVREYLLDHGFQIMTRDESAKPWIRDYVYGVSPNAGSDR